MPFTNFTNPYKNPADVPQRYRQHIYLRDLDYSHKLEIIGNLPKHESAL
ncbi:hypothetical protein [Nodularia sp. UHCC 0506]|nr:hypothetical protein [Nodularia sp. UHCC 0506]MEA5513451.1 hypothetical protein [Nodularia sp. UHCC 0506]